MFQSDTLARRPAAIHRIGGTRAFLAAFVVLLLATSAPVFSLPIPPLADYVNHLARMHIIAHNDQNPLLHQFYDIGWEIIPNLIMDVVVPPLARVMNIYRAGQTFIFSILALTVTGVMAVHGAVFRRLSPWPLVSFLFLYNNVLMLGFMNYLFGLAVALWGVAAWIWLRERSVALRAGVSTAFVLTLFLCHLFAVGLYGLVLLCFESWRFWRTRPRLDRCFVCDLLAFGLPFLPVLPLMMASPTIGLATEMEWDWDPWGKLSGLLWVVDNYAPSFDYLLGGLILAGLAAAVATRRLRLHPVGAILLALGTVIYIAMPRVLFGSWGADLRLPIAIVFLLLGFMRLDFAGRTGRYTFYTVVLGLAVARFVSVQIVWERMEEGLQDFRASFERVEPGSTILVAQADHPTGTEAFNNAYTHAPCLAMVDRSALVSRAFSVKGKQILEVRPPYRDLVDPDDLEPPTVTDLFKAAADPAVAPEEYWNRWPEHYDYVYVLFTDAERITIPPMLRLIHQGGHFQLFKVERPAVS